VTLHSLRDRALFVAPVRLVLAVVWLVAARVAGAPSAGALLAFAGGAFVTAFTLLNDPRSRLLGRPEPRPAPPEARVASPLRQALGALVPSTIGVSVLAGIALAVQPTLTAALGGICGGLAVAGTLGGLRVDPSLYVEPKSGALYRR
jgi:hypothetical protein